MLSKEEYDRRRAVGISERNIYRFLEKVKTGLEQTNYQLIWLLVKGLQAEYKPRTRFQGDKRDI